MLINGKISSNKLETANAFNTFFVNLPRSLLQTNNIPINTNNYPLDFPDFPLLNDPNFNFILSPVSKSEILDVINSLKNSKSVGPDFFSIKIVKKFAYLFAEPLCHIVNECFHHGCFPNLLKLSKVIPFHKKGDATLLCNYRPISLLSVFSKIFEKLLANRIINFLENYHIISKNQHGFYKSRSTITALAK